MVMHLVSVEAGVDPALLGDGVHCRRISREQWARGAARHAEVVVWNNNLVLPAGARENAPAARLLVNWGTGDANILCRRDWSDIRLTTTGGYCTEAVRDFVLGNVTQHAPLGADSVVGVVGMGRIGYAIARRIAPEVKRVAYHARHRRPGLDFDPLPLAELLACADLIVVAANTRDPLDLAGLRANQRRPFIVTVSPDQALPVAAVAGLIDDGTLRGILSDNPAPAGRPDLARFYTGKVAYRSEPARRHKHQILAKELLTVRRCEGRPDPTIYIARHGRTEWNVTGRRQGRLDSPLTAEGTAQAHALARLAQARGVLSVYCSPLPRAVATATIVARHLNTRVEVVDDFVEMDFGGLQGEPLSAEERFPAFTQGRRMDRLHTAYPLGGESYFDLSLRVQAEIDAIAASGETSLVVGHGSVNRMMLPFLVDGLSLEAAAARRQPSDLVIGVNLTTRTEEHLTLEGQRQ